MCEFIEMKYMKKNYKCLNAFNCKCKVTEKRKKKQCKPLILKERYLFKVVEIKDFYRQNRYSLEKEGKHKKQS